MARIKYDVSGVEGRREQPQPAIYKVKIAKATLRKENNKNKDIEVVFEVQDAGKYKGVQLWKYVSLLESAEWRLRQLTDALGLPPSGTLDTDALVGKNLRIKVVAGEYNGDYKAEVGTFLPLSEDGEEEAEEAEEAEGEEAEEEEAEEPEAEEEEEPVDIDTLNRTELKKLISDYDLGIKVLKSMSDDDIRSAIRAAAEEEPEEEEAEEPEEEEAEEPTLADELAAMDRAALKAYIKAHEMDIKVFKSTTDDALREAIAAAVGGSEEEEEGETPEDGYDDLAVGDLKAELAERGIAATGNKDALITALRKDDAAPAPF